MADAAYETVKTLQQMLDNKNETIQAKEGIIKNLKDQMMEQRKTDLEEIAVLRKRLTDTGDTTLSKMHEIVAKHDSNIPSSSMNKNRPQTKYDNMKGKEIEKILHQKDQLIKRLETDKNTIQERHNNT
jgi:hypothetical protein